MGNSDTVRGMYELFGAGDLDGFFDHIADDFVDHENGPAFEPTKAGTRQLFAAVNNLVPSTCDLPPKTFSKRGQGRGSSPRNGDQ